MCAPTSRIDTDSVTAGAPAGVTTRWVIVAKKSPLA